MAKKYIQNIHHQLWCTSMSTSETNYTIYTYCTIHINVGRYMWRYAVMYWHALHSLHFQSLNRGSDRSIWSLIFYTCIQNNILYDENYCFITRISFVLVKYVNLYTLGQYEILPAHGKYLLHYESWIIHEHYQKIQLKTWHLVIWQCN